MVPKRGVGRPSLYSEALTDEFCRRLAEGESSLSICRDEHMPCWGTIWNWLDQKPEFLAKYARAREIQGHHEAAAAVEEAVNAADAALGRLAYDARRWHAAKLAPKVYGEKIEIEGTVRAIVSSEPLTEDEWIEQHGEQHGTSPDLLASPEGAAKGPR